MKKIAFCGSSGCGKTTLAKIISKELGIPFIPMSQKGMFSEEKVNEFKTQTNGNYNPDISHQMIIYLSNRFPNFGLSFQREVLRIRTSMIKENESFITDRSPVDNIVYFLLQNGAMTSGLETRNLIIQASQACLKLDMIVLLNPNPEGKIENDGSRILNPFYQKIVHSAFESVIEDYLTALTAVKICQVKEWDIKKRIEFMLRVINNS